MAIKVTIDKHGVAYPSNLLAQRGGAHIKSVTLTADTDNGSILALGDYIDLDLYEDDGTVADFEAVVRKQAGNGNYYVEVIKPGNAWFVYTEPVIAEEYSKKFTKESNFYNAKGDEARVYQLAVGDVFEVSAEAVSGTLAENATIDTITNRKMVIAQIRRKLENE